MNEYLILQLTDSAFPTGGFVHSGGLEAAYFYGEVQTTEDLELFLNESLKQAGSSVLPILNSAWENPEQLKMLSIQYDAFLNNHVTNRASIAQGRAFLMASQKTFDLIQTKDLSKLVFKEKLKPHFAPLFGAVMRWLELEKAVAQRMLLFMIHRDVLSAAVRLGIVGTYEGQRLQFEFSKTFSRILEKFGSWDASQLTQTAPLLDLMQGGQDRLYSRLFQS